MMTDKRRKERGKETQMVKAQELTGKEGPNPPLANITILRRYVVESEKLRWRGFFIAGSVLFPPVDYEKELHRNVDRRLQTFFPAAFAH